MNRYYAESKIVQWFRKSVFKIDKPHALRWGEWDKWDKQLKKSRPIAFFVTETLPSALEWIPAHSIDYLDNFRYYVINRVDGSHRLDSTLKKGAYHEFSDRLLFSMFDSFVDFIEVEEARSHIAWADRDDTAKYNVPWWSKRKWFRWGKWRCEEAAIDHLKWEMTLDQPDPTNPNHQVSPHQAESAREKMSLYTWWKHIRPGRGDDWEVSGLKDFWAEMDAKYGDNWMGMGHKSGLTPAEKAQYNKLNIIRDELEEQWRKEDEQMMIRLIKIRESLWT